MKKHTNMDRVRDAAITFLNVDIQETKFPFVASHPFTSAWLTMSMTGELLDLHDPAPAKRWREALKKKIQTADLISLFYMMNKPYILTFLDFVEKDLSAEDLGLLLGTCWQLIEQISLDKAVTGERIVNMFKRAAKNTLMDERERAIYDSLPEYVTVYRGVTNYNKRKKRALSWTTKREIAEWFANRFNTGTGEIWTLTVPKDRILCAFEGRESEVIVNLYGYKDVDQMIIERA